MSKLLEAIRCILRGEIYLSGAMTTRLLSRSLQGVQDERDDPLASLSDRELEVLQLFGEGHSRREIADALRVSVKTVETHRSNLMKKLHLTSAAELTRYALYWVSRP